MDIASLADACAAGDADLVRTLLQDRGDVDGNEVEDGSEGFTLLMGAAQGGSCAVVRLLLGRGADPTRVDGAGYTALAVAVENGHKAVVDVLLDGVDYDKDALNKAVAVAAMTNRVDCLAPLVAKGADIDSKTEYDWTPLHFAASLGHTGMVYALLSTGARVNISDTHERTPVDLAVEWSRIEAIETLLSFGAQNPTFVD